ncbi:MAG: Holliday junction branch migration protein RuvA [Planctomycetota bacterium]
MIAKIYGTLQAIERDKALVDLGQGLVYEVMLPAFAATRLAASEGRPVTLHTLTFIESTTQGGTMFPRLAGFLTAEDKSFFELFVTCKGIGHKRALRAMVLDTATLASAIADRDAKLIQTMPEVGKKLAETVVVTLRDKVEPFVSGAAYPSATGPPEDGQTRNRGTLARESLEVLMQLGEQRAQAVQWIDRVLAADDRPDDAQGVVAAVYRLKAGG